MIPIAEPMIGEEELNNVIEVVKSGWVSSRGEFILEFEKLFAEYCGRKFGIATSNGTVALHLAETALGIGKDDEVIVPTLTFIATANTVAHTNAKPIFVDSHLDYWCIDPEKIEEAITPKTKAIIPVHLYGHPCDMDAIISIAKKYNLYIIEDAAEAHGAEYKEKKVGSFGDISCFSFYGNKIITTGEGGMCLTDDEELARKMKILRDHGMNPNKKYWHDIIGFNYRMTNMQAAVGVAQLKKINIFIERKREIAQWYADALKEMKDKEIIKLHPEMPWAKCVFWLYSVIIKDDFDREKLIKSLNEQSIDTRPFFYPIHTFNLYQNNSKLFVAEQLSKNGISLPSSVKIQKEDVDEIVGKLCVILKLKR